MAGRRNCTEQEEEVYRFLEGCCDRAREYNRLAGEGRHIQLHSAAWRVGQKSRERSAQQLKDQIEWYHRLTEALDPLEKRIFRLRYEEKRTWASAAITLGMSERQAQRIQRSAVRRIARTVPRGKLLVR